MAGRRAAGYGGGHHAEAHWVWEIVEETCLMTVMRRLARMAPLRMCYAGVRALSDQFGFGLRWVGGLLRLGCFAGESIRFCRMNRGSAFALRWRDIQPC